MQVRPQQFLRRTIAAIAGITTLTLLGQIGTVAIAQAHDASGKPTPGCAAGHGAAPNVFYAAAANPAFSTLTQAIEAAGLSQTLTGKGPFTLFTPTNAAFAALPPGTLEDLLKPENRAKLQKLLTYHLVSGHISTQSLKSGTVRSVSGAPLTLQVKEGKVRVNDATVTSPDGIAGNGVVHVIDRVLLPPDW